MSFAPTSSVTYNQAGDQNIYNATYGDLTIAGSGVKTALGNITVQGVSTGLTLNNNLAMSTYSLTMDQAGTAVNGSNEVIGLVKRNHAFTGTMAYAFNRSNVTMALASNGSADITLGMYPGTDPTTGLGSKYVQRKYTLSSLTDVTGNHLTANLYYTDTEVQGSANEAKLGFYKYSGGTWSKFGYNRWFLHTS